MNSITLLGISVLFFYSLSQILSFYGVGKDVYGPYILFYFLMILCMIVLPNDYPSVT
jgi:hypothetical protein